jgi:hypothetical protein
MNLKEALMRAYAEQGTTPPAPDEQDHQKTVLAPGPKRQVHAVQVTYGAVGERPRIPAQGRQSANASKAQATKSFTVKNAKSESGPRSLQQTYRRAGATRSNSGAAQVGPVVTRPVTTVRLDNDARCQVKSSVSHAFRFLSLPMTNAAKESIDEVANPDIHEMALGLDFGTSSVKIVIGDLASDKAYAVPFFVAKGIDAYLLPSRVFESSPGPDSGRETSFNLLSGDLAFRDLKLSLLAEHDSEARQVEVIAFLALAIQCARAWFFEEHKAIYKRVKCLWQLRIGLPAATALDNKFVPLLEKILRAAWQSAGMQGEICRPAVQEVRKLGLTQEPGGDDPEVRVIPEMAAQIFGFVVSTSFDVKAANHYLMVDVGAGTVDSSLFKVVPGRGGQWNFEFYTAVVQPYGVSNLHAYRVNWWLSKIESVEAADVLAQELKATQFSTDLGISVPAYNKDYFSGVHLDPINMNEPDLDFLAHKLIFQVQGSTLWRAWKDNYLAKEQLTKVPMFLCGGGSRSDIYLRLEKELANVRGCPWLSAEPWQLNIPLDLVADGVNQQDFDRLSVAYGLSKVNVGQITQAMPIPMVPIEKQESFTDRYIDKDQT